MPGTRRSPGYSSSASTRKPARTSVVTIRPSRQKPSVEVVVAPALQAVDAERDRMVVVDEQLAARLERGGDARAPSASRSSRSADHALRRVDEVEAAAPQLRGQRCGVGLDPEDLRPALARLVEQLLRRVDRGDDGAVLRELRGRLAGPALEVQHALLRQVAERRLHDRRQPGRARAAVAVQRRRTRGGCCSVGSIRPGARSRRRR